MFRSEKQVITVQAENKKLVEPLRKAKEELHRLKGIFNAKRIWVLFSLIVLKGAGGTLSHVFVLS